MNPLNNLQPMSIPSKYLHQEGKNKKGTTVFNIISEWENWYLINEAEYWIANQDKIIRKLTIYHEHPFIKKAFELEKHTEKCSYCQEKAPQRFIAIKAIDNVRT